jgi:penicillin amidase
MRPSLALALAFLCSCSLRGDEPASAPDLLKKARQVLSRLEGEIRLPGLKEPVEVLRDKWGIPHIYAKNADDLFFAQGFVAAQDRLFQLDWWRRQGVGEMAEVLGEEAVEADRFARLLRPRDNMEAEWASYSLDTRRIAIAFTRGINACIDHLGDKLPIEFRLLGYAPKKWQPEDVLTRTSGITMTRNFRHEIARAQLVAALGIDKARWLAPVDPPRAWGPAPGLDLACIDQRILTGYTAATKVLRFQPAKTESNNWVLAGSRSISGKPLLASDPHRAITLPSLRYLVHLNAPGWNVIGSGEPGLPGVAIGHNERIAWGFTIVGTDQSDIYVESTDPKNPDRYRVGDGWASLRVLREKIKVKGRPDREVELRFSRHGPVLFQDSKTHRAFALKWAGSEPGGAAYLASLAVDRARNRAEFLKAMERWKVPGLNFVYADVDGNIGWIAAALTPIRKNHDGLLPVPGASKRFDWQGYLSVADLPQQFNPESGFLATANHNILPRGYKHAIGYEFAAPWRYQRIRESLESKKRWDLEGFKAIQHDSVSLPGKALARLLAKVDLDDDSLTPFAKRLIGWDGKLSLDSTAGPLYAAWVQELKKAMWGLHAPKSLQKSFGLAPGFPVLLAALETTDPRWFGGDARAARDRLVRETFARAVKRTRDAKRWGAVHTATFRHPLGSLSPAHARAFNVGPFERTGDEFTPNNTRHDDSFQQLHGATYRHLQDLADWDRGLATSAPGQSGQPGSPYYGDLAPLWARGEYFPLAFSRKKVESVTKHRLWLRPRK